MRMTRAHFPAVYQSVYLEADASHHHELTVKAHSMALLVARGRWLNSVDLLPAIFVVFLNARLKLRYLIAVRGVKRQDLSIAEDIDYYFNASQCFSGEIAS
jgi:hypothetical protein